MENLNFRSNKTICRAKRRESFHQGSEIWKKRIEKRSMTICHGSFQPPEIITKERRKLDFPKVIIRSQIGAKIRTWQLSGVKKTLLLPIRSTNSIEIDFCWQLVEKMNFKNLLFSTFSEFVTEFFADSNSKFRAKWISNVSKAILDVL